MAKGASKGGKAEEKDKADASAWTMDGIPDALRDAGKRAAELAQNPYARSLLAAGLVAAAAALASNKNVREATRRNLRTATEAAEAGAENVGKVGIAIVNAATEAVQRMMNLAGAAAPDAAGTKPKRAPAKAKAAAPKTRKPAAKKPAAAKAATSAPRKTTAKPASAKPARKPAVKTSS